MSTPRDDDLTAPLPATTDTAATFETMAALPDEPETYTDDIPQPAPVPLDLAAERAAFENLLALIHAHKDPGTVAEVIDLDAYLAGLD